MKSLALASLACASVVTSWGAETASSSTLMTDRERIDSLIQQNRLLTEQIQHLQSLCERPKTKEEAFAACMQAAKNTNGPMAAESVGEHCDKLLKN